MKKNRKRLSILTAILALVFTLGACGGPSSSATAPSNSGSGTSAAPSGGSMAAEQVFRIASSSGLTGLSPIMNTSAPENEMHDIMFETLVASVADENNNAIIRPAAAESWTISDDGKVYTFKIRDNAVWNDGVPFTADDVVFTYQTMADPATGSTNAWLFEGLIENYTEALYNDGENPENNKLPTDIGVKKIDEKTVEFTLKRAAPFFLELMTGAKPIRQDKYEEWGSAYGSSADKIVTNGPFSIESWTQNIQMTLVRNETYWNKDNVKLDKIERKVLQDAATMVQALLSGEIDRISTNDPDWQEMIKADGGFYEFSVPTRAPEFLAFNCANEYFAHPKIRQAFSLAIDRDKFVQDLRAGMAEPITTLLPPIINVGDTSYQELVDGANLDILGDLATQYPDPKALLIEGLTEAGFDPDPAKMTIHFASRGTTELSKKMAEWYYQQFEEKLGVTITIDMMEWNIMWDKINAGDYDIAVSGWGTYYNDPEGLLSLFDLEKGYFHKDKSGWDDADAVKYAEVLQKAVESVDINKKGELYLEAEKLLVGTAVIAPTYLPINYNYLSNKVSGYHENPNSYVDFTLIYITE